eukprot:3062583-Rhodomonas_salina.3
MVPSEVTSRYLRRYPRNSNTRKRIPGTHCTEFVLSRNWFRSAGRRSQKRYLLRSQKRYLLRSQKRYLLRSQAADIAKGLGSRA